MLMEVVDTLVLLEREAITDEYFVLGLTEALEL